MVVASLISLRVLAASYVAPVATVCSLSATSLLAAAPMLVRVWCPAPDFNMAFCPLFLDVGRKFEYRDYAMVVATLISLRVLTASYVATVATVCSISTTTMLATATMLVRVWCPAPDFYMAE